MIEAKHSFFMRLFFRWYEKKNLKKYFDSFYCVNEFPDIPPSRGLMVLPNHMSWWDGFFVDYVCSRFLDRSLYIMMLEEQLKKYYFFRKLGAYSINPGNVNHVRKALQYTIDRLADPWNYVVLFPQGELLPYDKRPFRLHRLGIQYCAQKAAKSFLMLPVAFRIHYSDKKLPEVAVRFGRYMESLSVLKNFRLFEDEFNSNVKALDEAAFEKDYFREILHGN